jgi:hypothetical protein
MKMSSPLLFLHGAVSDKNITKYLQDRFHAQKIKNHSFNFTGHGGTNLAASSLENRLFEAEKAIEHFELSEPLNLCGSSMGGYLAIKLLEKHKVNNLILFAPAVYDKKAFNIQFGNKFSEIIRKENSWKNSDAFRILKNFQGNALIFIGEKDEVIPKELVSELHACLIQSKSTEIVKIPDCPHKIHRWLSTHEEWSKKVAEKISELF